MQSKDDEIYIGIKVIFGLAIDGAELNQVENCELKSALPTSSCYWTQCVS